MKEYLVTFTRYYEYYVYADNARDAEESAYEKFRERCLKPVANTSFDEVEIECLDGDDEEEDE